MKEPLTLKMLTFGYRGLSRSQAEKLILKNKEREAQRTNAEAKTRAVTSDWLNSTLNTNLTVSTLMVGVAISLMSGIDTDQLQQLKDWDAEGDNAISWELWYNGMLLLSWLGFLFSGAEFGLAMTLAVSLTEFQIHPDDYAAARIWFDENKVVWDMFPYLSCFSYFSLALGTMSFVSMRVYPGASGALAAFFGFTMLTVFASGLYYTYLHFPTLRVKMLYHRKSEVKPWNNEGIELSSFELSSN